MLNSAQIIGRVARDPDVRYMPSGEAVANLTVATSESWKDKQTGEKKEATEWHRVTFFGRLAEIAGEYLKKGSLVYIQGKIQTRKFTDKDGTEKQITEIRASDMKMLGKNEGHSSPPAAPRQQPAQRTVSQTSNSGFDDMTDDIPF